MKVIVNFAISADGKIGTSKRDASKFTSRRDLERLWEIRMRADAILVGRGTLEADNMSMTIPPECNPKQQPLRLIASRKGQFKPEHPVFQKPGGDIHLLTTHASSCNILGHQTHFMPLSEFLSYCKDQLGIKTLLCEGGGQLVYSLAQLGVLSEIHLTIAGHTLIGGQHAPNILGGLQPHLSHSQHFTLSHFEPLQNGECFLSYASTVK